MTQPARLPANEAARLECLNSLRVLDSQPEPLFEQIVVLAAELCGVPMALVSLVDLQRQWFKANVGLPGVPETHRDLSFCAHAILSDELMEVEDAATDPRFADNPLVTAGPLIRYYAGAPLRMPGGERLGTLCVIGQQPHKLTEDQRSALTQLAGIVSTALVDRRARIGATAAQSDFLSRASHELRTPLNAVMGFAQLVEIMPDKDPVKVTGYAQQIRLAGEHMLTLVNDLLDLSRAADGNLSLELQALPLRTAADEAAKLLRGMADARQLSIQVDIADDAMVIAERARLHQVLLNLGSNAVKYNRVGGSVRFHLEPSAPDRVALTVEDTGIGMTPAQIDRLFQPFDRLGLDRTAIQGVGLGMIITRSLVEEMGGSIQVQSTPQVGTRVCVQFRVPSADSEPPGA